MTGYKTIGIIGGMGPEATADLYVKIVRVFQKECGATADADFPAMLIASVPIPDVLEKSADDQLALQMLLDAARTLEGDGAAFLVIACNTVHYRFDDIQAAVRIPILHIAACVAEETARLQYGTAGLLATNTTIERGIYERALAAHHTRLLVPEKDDQATVMRVIEAQLAGRAGEEERVALMRVIERLQKRGADAVILGCTDLPLVANLTTSVPIIDCNAVYAAHAAHYAMTHEYVPALR